MNKSDSILNRWRHAPHIVTRRIRNEVLLIPVRRTSAELDGFYTLNAVATEIWQEAGKGKTAAEIAQYLTEHFQVNHALAASDVDHTIAELLAIGALVPG